MINLRRVTSNAQYIPQIDGLRFIAILSVVCFHIVASLAHNGALSAPQTSLDLRRLSKRGVELFFVISGFVLALPFARAYRAGTQPPSLRAYFLRRLTRLEPPYILALVLSAAVLLISHTLLVRDLVPDLLASAFYTHHLFYATNSKIITPSWSLEIEVQFYILVPFLTLVFTLPRGARRAVIAATMLIAGIGTVGLADTWIDETIIYYLAFFLAGFLATDDFLQHPNMGLGQKPNALWDVLAIVLLALLWMPSERISHVILPFLLVSLIRACFSGKLVSRALSSPVPATIGGMCYTIYLYHMVIISSIGRISKPLHFGNAYLSYIVLQTCIMLPIVLALCTLLFLLIERPCMSRDWPRKLWLSLSPRTRHL